MPSSHRVLKAGSCLQPEYPEAQKELADALRCEKKDRNIGTE